MQVQLGKLNGTDHLGYQDINGRKILEWILNKKCVWSWTGFIWLRKGTGSRLLGTQSWNFGFHKSPGISWPDEWQLVVQEGICSLEWVTDRRT